MQPGDEIVLTENQKPVARIVSEPSRALTPAKLEFEQASQSQLGAWKGKLHILVRRELGFAQM